MFWKDNQMSITPLGGVGMIGQNCFLYQSNNSGLVVDCGIKPQTYEEKKKLGLMEKYFGSAAGWVEPPERLDVLDGLRPEKIMGIVTHAHLDHIGAVRELSLRDIPVYLSGWSKSFLERYVLNLKIPLGAKFFIIPWGTGELTHGNFQISFLPLRHSIPGTFGVLMSARGKNILHLSDFKFNGMKDEVREFEEKLQALKKEKGKIHCLIFDVLNSDLEGFTPPESLVIAELEKIMRETHDRLIITFFNSNLFRMKEIIESAHRLGKTISFAGGMIKSYRQVERYLSRPVRAANFPSQNSDVLLVGGSQGEENSALAKMAWDEHPVLKLRRKDRVVSSARAIPGNEEGIRILLTQLHKRGIPIIIHYGEREKIGLGFDAEERFVHVSGHGSKEDLLRVIKILNPKVIVPFHAPEERVELFEKIVGARVNRLRVGETLKI